MFSTGIPGYLFEYKLIAGIALDDSIDNNVTNVSTFRSWNFSTPCTPRDLQANVPPRRRPTTDKFKTSTKLRRIFAFRRTNVTLIGRICMSTNWISEEEEQRERERVSTRPEYISSTVPKRKYVYRPGARRRPETPQCFLATLEIGRIFQVIKRARGSWAGRLVACI